MPRPQARVIAALPFSPSNTSSWALAETYWLLLAATPRGHTAGATYVNRISAYIAGINAETERARRLSVNGRSGLRARLRPSSRASRHAANLGVRTPF